MPDFIQQAFYDAEGGSPYGWSETLYMTASTIEVARETARLYIARRLGILHPDYAMQEVRVSNVTVFRDSLAIVLTQAQGNGQYERAPGQGTALKACNPWDRLLMRAESGSTARRALEIGGFPINVANAVGIYGNVPALFGQRMTRFIDFVLNPGVGGVTYGLRRQTSTPPVTLSAAVGPYTENTSLLSVVATPNMDTALGSPAVGSIVRLSRIRDMAGVAGTWTLQQRIADVPAVGQFTYVLKPKGRKAFFGTYTNKIGIIRKITLSYPALTSLQPERVVERRTGRPFDSSRGRRSPVV